MAVLENGVWDTDKSASELPHVDRLERNFGPETGRYHLYVSRACPFAHRPWLVISVLGLDKAISVSSVSARRYGKGWEFDADNRDIIGDSKLLSDIYLQSKPDYSGAVTVPVLFDRHERKIVSTDSASLSLKLATEWLPLAEKQAELVPALLCQDIDQLNRWLHASINRKVYQVGFAKHQDEYERTARELFSALDEMEKRLTVQPFLFGEAMTISDLFLLPSLVRFEAVYAIHFRANTKSLAQLPNLYAYMLRMLAVPGVLETIDMEHAKLHYYFSHRHINPTGIVPTGPLLTWLITPL